MTESNELKEREKVIQEIMEKLSKKPWSFPAGTAAKSIREDRDSL